LPKEIVSLKLLKELDLANSPNLLLSIEQKIWIDELISNGCKLYIKNDDNGDFDDVP